MANSERGCQNFPRGPGWGLIVTSRIYPYGVTEQSHNACDTSRATFTRDTQGILSLSTTRGAKAWHSYRGHDNHLRGYQPAILGASGINPGASAVCCHLRVAFQLMFPWVDSWHVKIMLSSIKKRHLFLVPRRSNSPHGYAMRDWYTVLLLHFVGQGIWPVTFLSVPSSSHHSLRLNPSVKRWRLHYSFRLLFRLRVLCR